MHNVCSKDPLILLKSGLKMQEMLFQRPFKKSNFKILGESMKLMPTALKICPCCTCWGGGGGSLNYKVVAMEEFQFC